MRIVFFGTSNVALPILETLHQHHDVVLAVTAPDAKVGRKQELQESPVSVLAQEMDIEVLKPVTVKHNQEFLLKLRTVNADIFIVVSYGKILPLEIINLPKYKTLNVHFSLLPKYRGSSPIQYALMNGEKETGTSIFVLDEKMDTGPVVVQEKINIEPDDNFITLSQKLSYLSAKSLLNSLPKYFSGEIVPEKQNDSLATYTKIINKENGKIDWETSAFEIYNKFRAFYPWPGIWTTWNGKKIKILDCEPFVYESGSSRCGEFREGTLVVCGNDTCLKLKIVQLEGKTTVPIQSFVNGYSQIEGSMLGV